MNKLRFSLFALLATLTATAQPHWHLDRTGLRDVAPDTIQTVSYPLSIAKTTAGIWDFSALEPLGEALISHLQVSGQAVDIVEEETAFHFTAQPDGNYFSGWENDFKEVILLDAYNKLPYPLYVGRRTSSDYTASGLFINTGIPTFITGKYEMEVLDEGTILLPGGHERCAASCIKTIDSFSETGGGVTDVVIEKHLWYVPYYSFPILVTTQTTYEYNGKPYDTLRTACYTINPMLQPAIRTMNDTTICLGQSIEITATGNGNFYWRENVSGSTFQPFNNTIITPEATLSYIFMAEDEQCNSQPAFDTLTVNVEIAPTLLIANRNISHCARTQLYLNATSNVPERWFERNDYDKLIPIEGNLVGPEKSTVYIAQAGNSCLTITDSITVSIIPMDMPEMTIITSGKDAIFDIENYSANHFYYNLNFGDGSPSDYPAMSLHHYAATGSYTAVLTLTGKQTGCEAAFEYLVVIDENDSNPMILYPNPANYLLNVIAPSGITFYRIIDISGTSIYNETTRPGNETAVQINIPNLPQGQYLIQLNTIGGPMTRAFIKN
ncbi:MAG: T9SS type A sorting domain-containing protein [Prevotellaceae bacterium]|jgi:hypothetical protein|nr:T9SS type A sorting domain-containing protein [Prevotellaceae bacterium]